MYFQADDVIGILKHFLSHEYLENIDLFVNTLKDEPTFKPSGTLLHSFHEKLGGMYLSKIVHQQKMRA